MSQLVGERVARVRAEMKMTQAELAAEMTARLGREVRPLTVTRLEGGKRPIGVDELVAAAGALNVKPADLLTDDDLPLASVRLVAAGQSLARATNALQQAVVDWVSAQDLLNQYLNHGQKALDLLPSGSRTWLEILGRAELSVVISEAQKDEEARWARHKDELESQ